MVLIHADPCGGRVLILMLGCTGASLLHLVCHVNLAQRQQLSPVGLALALKNKHCQVEEAAGTWQGRYQLRDPPCQEGSPCPRISSAQATRAEVSVIGKHGEFS